MLVGEKTLAQIGGVVEAYRGLTAANPRKVPLYFRKRMEVELAGIKTRRPSTIAVRCHRYLSALLNLLLAVLSNSLL